MFFSGWGLVATFVIVRKKIFILPLIYMHRHRHDYLISSHKFKKLSRDILRDLHVAVAELLLIRRACNFTLWLLVHLFPFHYTSMYWYLSVFNSTCSAPVRITFLYTYFLQWRLSQELNNALMGSVCKQLTSLSTGGLAN